LASALPAALAERAARARGEGERAAFRHIELPSEALAQIRTDDPRRAELVIPPLEPPPALADGEGLRVRLETLQRFLRCPIQGWARHWLREEDDAEGMRFVADEPLDASSDRVRALVRSAFWGALERGLHEPPLEALEAALERAWREARGRGWLPVGELGNLARLRVGEDARRRLALLREARPGVQRARAVRFGSVGSTQAARESQLRALPAVTLSVGGRAVTIEGRTRPLLEERAPAAVDGDLLTLVQDQARQADRGRVMRLLGALEAYVDHVALAAAGHDRVARRVVILGHDASWEAALAPIGRDAAARWLGAVVQDLLQGEPRFLPVEAVLLEEDAMRRGDPRLTERLQRAVETVRTKWEGGSSRWGPIRNAARHDAPEPRDLVRLVGRRLAPFFQHVRAPVRTGRDEPAQGLMR
jgi:exonuclease V gamma subunit